MSQLKIRSDGSEASVEMARLIKERVPEFACRVCGTRNFALLESPDTGFRTHLRRENKRPPRMFVEQRLVSLVCTNCGHIEQFAEAILIGAQAHEYGEDTNG